MYMLLWKRSAHHGTHMWTFNLVHMIMGIWYWPHSKVLNYHQKIIRTFSESMYFFKNWVRKVLSCTCWPLPSKWVVYRQQERTEALPAALKMRNGWEPRPSPLQGKGNSRHVREDPRRGRAIKCTSTTVGGVINQTGHSWFSGHASGQSSKEPEGNIWKCDSDMC